MIIFLTLVNLLFAVSFAQAQDNVPFSDETEERNEQLTCRFYEKVRFSNNPAVVDEIFAPEYVAHDIGDRKGFTENADEQKNIAAFFWNNGKMSGTIDYQIAECDLMATRRQWQFQPETWWLKLLNGRERISVINVFRFKTAKLSKFGITATI